MVAWGSGPHRGLGKPEQEDLARVEGPAPGVRIHISIHFIPLQKDPQNWPILTVIYYPDLGLWPNHLVDLRTGDLSSIELSFADQIFPVLQSSELYLSATKANL